MFNRMNVQPDLSFNRMNPGRSLRNITAEHHCGTPTAETNARNQGILRSITLVIYGVVTGRTRLIA